MVLCSDCNLTEEIGKEAAAALQPVQETPTYLNSWIVKSSMIAESSDVLFYKGAQGEVLRLFMGNNFTDRGMWRDCHDAFGIQLHLP